MSQDKNLKRPYKLFEYDPEWVEKFKEFREVLGSVFSDKALRIEHIGSTAMPSMNSKGVIDICVIVDHMESFEKEKMKLEELGYKYEDNYIGPDTIMIYKEKANTEKDLNVHVFAKDSMYFDKFILTRDYFLTHPEQIEKYRELKTGLAEQFLPRDYPAYRAGKQDFLREILELSQRWRSE